MSSASVTHDFANGTVGDADQVDQNFTDLVTFLNSHVVHNHADQWPASMPLGLLVPVVTNNANTGAIGATDTVLQTLASLTPKSATRNIKLTARWRSLSGTVANDDFVFRFKRDGTTICEHAVVISPAAASSFGMTFSFVDVNPTLAAHVYTLTLLRLAGTGTVTVHADTTYPRQFWAEDIGGT